MKVNIPEWLRQLPPWSHWIVGVISCAALGFLYFTTRTEVHTFDALSYTWGLEAKPLGLLFHPHHLLYGPLGWLAYQGATFAGYTGHADVPVQLLNGIVGALGIFFFWRFGSRMTGRPMSALGVSLLVGLCYSYWVYAAEVEVYTLATAFLTLALWIMALLNDRPTGKLALGLGLAHAGAILFHQTNVLFVLAIGAFLLSKPQLRRRNIVTAYALGSAVPTVIGYGYVAYASRFPDLAGFIHWFTDYAQSGQWGGFLSSEHLPALRSGLATSVSIEPKLATLFYLLAGVSLAAALYKGVRDRTLRPWLALAAVWLASYLIFFWWWEPWNIEFWIAILPMWGIWILLALPFKDEHGEASLETTLSPTLLASTGFALLPGLLAVALLDAHLEPIREQGDGDKDYYRQVTNVLAAVVRPDELVITRGNVLDLYIPFYTGHNNIISMRQLAQEQGGDSARILAELVARLDWATVTGQPFLIDQFILDESREPVRNPFGLTPDGIESLHSRYSLEPVAFRGEQTLFYGSPRYDNVGQTEWRFLETLQGWSVWGVDEPRFEREGWCFSGGVDPQLKGPIINIDADSMSELALDISLDAEVSYVQMFWRSPEGDYSLDNSSEIEIEQGRRVYVTSLAKAPGWADTIAQIRVDPIPGRTEEGPVVTACVHGIMLSEHEN